jgi:hypothetical protein
MKYIFSVILFILGFSIAYSQEDSSYTLGRSEKMSQGAVFDLSDPTGINIEVNLWGFVRLPGRYRIPASTTFMDLMSYAGGPLENTNMGDMRIIRTEPTGKTKVITLNYDDLLWEDKVSSTERINPILVAGDVVVIPQKRRYTFRDNLSFFIPLVSAVLTIATFIITLRK